MLNLFVSYSHRDDQLLAKFRSHLSPLENTSLIKTWYDQEIATGNQLQPEIDARLVAADIICLLISDNFLASQACQKEKDIALKLRKTKGISVIPIILSPCGWNLQPELRELLAIPKDGNPVTNFANKDLAWNEVIQKIAETCKSINITRSLESTDEFASFLMSADILTKSHGNKENLHLTDIFVFPKLKFYDSSEDSHKYDSSNLSNDVLELNKIIIAGETQAGKTTLCKVLFGIYRILNHIPVYLDDNNAYLGNPLAKIKKAFHSQYKNVQFESIDQGRIVPIVDNFHLAKYKDKYIEQYAQFKNQVLIVDDIFGLSINNQALIKEYHKFKIREFTALERNDLIAKWIQIKEDTQIKINPNYLQQSLDEKTELIENSLGIIFGRGIMPSYPFFILSILAAYEIQKPLNSEITSQGHCYQALIYLYLRKAGVKNDQIDIYINLLTEVAFRIFTNQGIGLSHDQLVNFSHDYQQRFNLPIPFEQVMQTLSRVNMCRFDSLNQFNFFYSYIYYFFVAKYLSENIDANKKTIDSILKNLHKDENAYITIFISHHTKSNYLLDELLLNAEILFETFKPATLDTEELQFFDDHEDQIIKALLPSYQHDPGKERSQMLLQKSNDEERSQEHTNAKNRNVDDATDELVTNLRISFKTVEVMGQIIKNRSGSLDLTRLEYIFEQGLKVHLRILDSFIEIIRDKEAEQAIIEFLQERLNQVIENTDGDKEMSIDQIEKLGRTIYWNMNFGVLHGAITKAIHSLGSSNLLSVAQRVSDSQKTPAAFIVNHGIKMWYSKTLRVTEIAEEIAKPQFSKTAQALMRYKVVEHCKLHNIAFKDLQRIEGELHIPRAKILGTRSKSAKR